MYFQPAHNPTSLKQDFALSNSQSQINQSELERRITTWDWFALS